jgi:hypothetical protein
VSFEQTVAASKKKWNSVLGKVEVKEEVMSSSRRLFLFIYGLFSTKQYEIDSEKLFL